MQAVRAVTFDVGQTLTELDCDVLSERLEERGVHADASRLEAALPAAWRAYDVACATSSHPWHLLMDTLLQGAGVLGDDRELVVDWLWREQPTRNLWRRPIAGMIDIARRVSAAGISTAIVSNSEGRLAELIEELGWTKDFACIADSGLLGMAKPAPGIFEWTGRALGVAPAQFVHIGDSWCADVEGIVALGGRAIWFGGASIAPEPPAGAIASDVVQLCRSPVRVEMALRAFGVPLC